MNLNDPKDLFTELIGLNQGPIFGYIYSLVHNRTDAEELHHQTVLTAWRKFDQFESGTDFLRWTLKIAQFEVLAFFREQRRDKLVFGEELMSQMLESHVDRMPHDLAELRQVALLSCLKKLKDEDRQLVIHCYERDVTVESVARQNGRPSRSVFNSLRRIRRALFDCINRSLSQGEGV